ncbi:hypothetical protein, partial [Erwinia sp. S38]|uniref:hypothetical protein n=1 Tax=Erwinia sp. S38 TaxID=2769338 RepID=UPI001F3F6220
PKAPQSGARTARQPQRLFTSTRAPAIQQKSQYHRLVPKPKAPQSGVRTARQPQRLFPSPPCASHPEKIKPQ